MNRKRTRIVAAVVLAIAATGLAIAQLTQPAPSPAGLFPEGALVYVEARDLKQLLQWWSSSDIKKRWEETTNYSAFQNSRLYQRLDERLSDLGKGAFTFTLDNLTEVAGTGSALALYDIGELKAVAVTRVGFTEASATELWASRLHLSKKKLGNQNYYVESKGGNLAFAYANPYLVVASDEALLQNVLRAIQDPQTTGRLTQSEKWKQLATRQPATGGILSLFLDQENLNTNRYFLNYWIHQSAEDLEGIQAAWINVERESGGIVEHRYFLRSEGGGTQALQDVGGYLKPFASVHHEDLILTSSPDASRVASGLLHLLNRLPDGVQPPGAPPVYTAAAERLSKAEARSVYMAKIDEAILAPASEKMLRLDQAERLQQVLAAAGPAAHLRFTYPQWDDRALFIQFPESDVLQLNRFDALDQKAFLDAMLDSFRVLNSTQDQGAHWIPYGNGDHKLDALTPLFVRFQNPWVVVATGEQEFQQVTQALPPAVSAPQSSYQEIELEKARWKYSRLMQRLDTGAYGGDQPLFFSNNLDSLLWTTEPVTRFSVLRNPDEEILRYEVK